MDISSVTLRATIMHCLVSSMRNTNNSSYYYSRPVLCSVAKSNATVGYQFIALASGKSLCKAEGFSACALQLQLSSQTGQEMFWLGELCVGMLGGDSQDEVWMHHTALFVHCSSSDKSDLYDNTLINDECGLCCMQYTVAGCRVFISCIFCNTRC